MEPISEWNVLGVVPEQAQILFMLHLKFCPLAPVSSVHVWDAVEGLNSSSLTATQFCVGYVRGSVRRG